MAEREDAKKKEINAGEKSAPDVVDVEDEESSTTEYEEIIEEITVTDYSDAEAEIEEEQVQELELDLAKEGEQKQEKDKEKEKEKEQKKESQKEKREDKEKVETKISSGTETGTDSDADTDANSDVADEEADKDKEHKSVDEKEIENKEADTKTESKILVAEKSSGKSQDSNKETPKKGSDVTDAKVEQKPPTGAQNINQRSEKKSDKNIDKGESLMPLLQGLLHKNLPPVKKANQNSQSNSQSTSNSNSISNSNRKINTTPTNTKANTTKSSSIVNNKSSGSEVISKNLNNLSNTRNVPNNINTRPTFGKTVTVKNPPTKPTTMTKNNAITPMTKSGLGSASASASGSGSGSVNSNSNTRQVDRLSVPQKEDSGTESGEDLRLIAAGLRDKLRMESDTDLIQEVTTALSRLESSLKEGKEIPVEGSKRDALLALVARLQTGLTSPEKLSTAADGENDGGAADGNMNFDETSSPEADAHRSNRQRFARRRNRNSRHTVGVSREELADARRYMEDMMLMENISNSTTPDGSMNPVSPPQRFPIEKNLSSSAITSQPQSVLYRPNQFVPGNLKNSTDYSSDPKYTKPKVEEKKKRPLSGNYSVSFDKEEPPPPVPNYGSYPNYQNLGPPAPETDQNFISDDNMAASKAARFSNKRQLMKRANTIDIPKTKKYNPDFDTDSETEDRGPQFGLKRTVQVNVKNKSRNVVPPFEPKTENDHKFLAFINKQSLKPGLGWTGSRSVSNWTSKFDNLKHSFEVGVAATATPGKPPQVPGHVPHNASKNYYNKSMLQYPDHPSNVNQNMLMHQQEAAERQRRQLDKERFEREKERIERDRLERQRQERERAERDRLDRQRMEREMAERERLEREFYEREHLERERIAAAEHMERERLAAAEYRERERLAAAEYRERERLAAAERAAISSLNPAPKPAPVNKFIHAPQSVFRPIDNKEPPSQPIFKPIPQLPTKVNTWQPPSQVKKNFGHVPPRPMASPQYLMSKQSISTPNITSPSSTASSPIGLPWVSKPGVDNSIFKQRANMFEERSLNDNRMDSQASYLQRHNSLRSAKVSEPQFEGYKKRPSLPNVNDPYMALENPYMPPESYNFPNSCTQARPQLPPPTNISFTYADYNRGANYKSYPCLPSAVETEMSRPSDYPLQRQDSLTDPQSVPLVLTNENPTYAPPPSSHTSDTSTLQPYANAPARQFDYTGPIDSAPTSPSVMTMQQTDYTDDDLDSDNMMEYRVESKVMGKPKSQTAVTVGRRTAHVSDDEVYGKNSRAAKNLLRTMKGLGGPNAASKPSKEVVRKPTTPTTPTSRKTCLSPDGRAYQAPIVEPLFPHITNFDAKRSPVYAPTVPQQQSSAKAPSKYQKPRTYTPPIPQMNERPTERSKYDRAYKEVPIYSDTPPMSQSQPAYQPVAAPQSFSNSSSYLSDTQTPYTVTYPTETPPMDSYQKPQHPRTLPLQREHISDNSSNSSVSYSIPSPGTNWTTNPIHVDDGVPVKLQRSQSGQILDKSLAVGHQYQKQQQQQYIVDVVPKEPEPTKRRVKSHKPDLAPKPQQTTPSNMKMPATPQGQLQYSELPSQQQYSAPPPQPQYSYKATSTTQPKNPSSAATNYPPQVPTQTAPQPKPTSVERPKLATMTASHASQSFDKSYQKPKMPLQKQKTFDGGVTTTITPLQTQNQVLSQQSLVTKQHQQFQQQSDRFHKHQQQRQQQQQISEIRRKSMGNALDMQQQQRKAAYFETTQQEIKTEYKSSAPPDTPDIVKSSLPKDDVPILKKFGPPQRHHYIPNSYQSPVTTTQTKKFETSTNVVKTTSQREVVQHSTHTAKPHIVETPATPQPAEDLIPRNIVFNNVSAFTSMTRRHDEDHFAAQPQQHRMNRLSKSDSWNQLVASHNAQPPSSPKFNASGNELRRTKSGHSLAVGLYEAGLDKNVISEKQKTVAAYFSGQKSPTSHHVEEAAETKMAVATRKSAINRTKTSEKVSASRKSLTSMTALTSSGGSIGGGGGLARSATMPHIASLNLLDESNVEDAFEQLMMGS